jgi:hypothetical protein
MSAPSELITVPSRPFTGNLSPGFRVSRLYFQKLLRAMLLIWPERPPAH